MSGLKQTVIKQGVMWLFQIGAAVILLLAGFGKLRGAPLDIETFTLLEMEPHGRIIIGICELIAGIGLLHPLSAAYASVLGVGVLTGAGLAHVGPLGFKGIEIFAPTYLSLMIVMILRWGELPFSAKRTRRL